MTYTLYTGVTRALPDTSYLKAIEIYLLFHIMLPFIIFLILFRCNALPTCGHMPALIACTNFCFFP